MADATIRAFCEQQREWLDLELQEETTSSKETEEGRSHVLQQLVASDVSVGLYGRTVVRLVAITAESDEVLLPAHRFTTGDEVEIRSKTDRKNHPSGVISEVTESSLSIALFPSKNTVRNSTDGDEEDDDLLGTPPLSVLPKSSIEVHRKLLTALNELEAKGLNHPVAGRVVQALFDARDTIETVPNNVAIQPFNTSLDDSQLDAISFALAANRSVSLCHGPPGTGKTTTVVELIQQAVRTNGWKVLVTAPSNVAVDNVLSRLVDPSSNTVSSKSKRKSKKTSPLKVVRLGHPARLQASILPYSLEALVQSSDGTDIVADVRAELQSFLRILSKPRARGNDKRTAYREIKALRKEVRTREEKVVQELIGNAQVVLATCVGAANKLLNDTVFDLVVIDEAAQSLEAACWIPALRGRRLVLAGDHCQLPPTIKSNRTAVLEGLGKTMFERAMELYGDDKDPGEAGRISRMLRVQYRMNETISNWASQALYGGNLVTHKSVQSRTLSQLTGTADKEGVAENPLLLIDTAGCGLYESTNVAGSRYNEGEAQLVVQHVQLLLELGVQQDQIAVITPYNGQVEVLRLTLLPEVPKLQIRSVDGFQGGEREAVVLSLVRSSERGGMDGIGFLRDDRRLNVAITRAKRHCCVICDTETVSQSPFVRNLIAWIDQHGEQRSALEFMSETNKGQMESDLMQAELEIQRLMEEASMAESKARKVAANVNLKTAEVEERRAALFIKIKEFAGIGKPGEKMVLSTELSKLDRKFVHEIAEEFCLGHESAGVDGVNRRITLTVLDLDAATLPDVKDDAPIVNDKSNDERIVSTATAPSFSVLRMDDDDEDDEGATEHETETEPLTATTSSVSGMNAVLGDLAKERAQREQQKPKQQAKKKNTKKKKRQKLGTQKKADENCTEMDQLDDMAFLDAQINMVQNSHGRTVMGKGRNYRTVVNGILIGKPKPQEQKKDPHASAALKAKLNKAQNNRKAKKKK